MRRCCSPPGPAARSRRRGHARAPVHRAGGGGWGSFACAPTSPFRSPPPTSRAARPRGRYLYEGKAFRTAPQGQRPACGVPPDRRGGLCGPTMTGSRRDVEIATLAWAASQAGGRSDLGLVLGDVALFDAFLAVLDLPQPLRARLVSVYASGRGLHRELVRAQSGLEPRTGERLPELLSSLPEGEATGVLKELWKLAGISPVGGRSPAEIVHRLCARAEQASAGRLSSRRGGPDRPLPRHHRAAARGLRPDRVARLRSQGGIRHSVAALGAAAPRPDCGRCAGMGDGLLHRLHASLRLLRRHAV